MKRGQSRWEAEELRASQEADRRAAVKEFLKKHERVRKLTGDASTSSRGPTDKE